MLGFYCRIGSLRENRGFPGVKLIKTPKEFMKELSPAELQAVREPVKTSETGEIVYDTAKGTLRIVSPRSESLSFFDGSLSGNVLQIANGTPTFQVVTASGMDGRPLRESGRILLFHQSDVTSRHIRYSSESMNAVEHWGKREALIRRASADVTLKLAAKFGGTMVYLIETADCPMMPPGIPAVFPVVAGPMPGHAAEPSTRCHRAGPV